MYLHFLPRCLLIAGLCLSAAHAGAQSPNLLILIADDLSPELVGCYGASNPVPTPTLDQLATQGVSFTRAYANPICSPTRAALMTGRYGFRTGVDTTVLSSMPGLLPAETILPEALAATGYTRALIGKWHLGTQQGDLTPNVQGWPHYAGNLDGGLSSYTAWTKVVDGNTSISTHYATTDQVDDALAWIGNQTQPWVLMLSFNAPHAPFHAPPANLHTQNLTGLSPNTTPVPFYRAMVESLDTEIGRLLTGISPLLPNTNIVFLGDNGTPREVVAAGIDPQHAKGSVYEVGCHVPMIIAGPAVTQPGRTYGEVMNVADLFPTMLELCGTSVAAAIPSGTTIDGVSLLPVLQGNAAPVRSFAFCEEWGTGFGDGYTVIGPQYKLLRFTGGGTFPHEELYDLLADPAELSDLLLQPLAPAAAAAHTQLQQDMDQLLMRGYELRYVDGCVGANGIADVITYRTAPPRLGGFFPYTPIGGSGIGVGCLTVFGWSNTQYNGLPLPADLSSYGMPGCNLALSIDAVIAAGGLGQTFTLPIPNVPAFLWANFHLQSFIADPAANPTGVLVSNALRCTIGQ